MNEASQTCGAFSFELFPKWKELCIFDRPSLICRIRNILSYIKALKRRGFFVSYICPMSSVVTATFHDDGRYAMPKQRQFILDFLKILSESQQFSIASKRLNELESGTPEHTALAEKVEALDLKVNGPYITNEKGESERDQTQANYKYFFLGGAIRGTKTVTTMVAGLAICKFFPGCRGHIIRKSNKNLVLAIQSMEKLLKGSSNVYWKRGQQEYFVQLSNGSRIYFTTEAYDTDKNLTKFLGMEMNWVLFEQLEELREETFTRVMGRLGSYYGLSGPIPPIILLATFNPTFGWLKKKIYDPWKKGELKRPYYYLELLPQDNPYVTEDQWQSWKNLPDDEYKRMIEGQWDIQVKNQFCYAFDPKRNVFSGDNSIDWRYDVWLSFDFNVDPMTCVMGQSDGETFIRIIREFRIPDSDTYTLCDQIKPWILGQEHNVKVTGDASGKNRMAGTRGHINHYEIIKNELGLNNSQFKLPSVNPFISDSRVFVNALLQRLPEFVIHESCEHLINDCKFVLTTTNREGEIEIKKSGSNEFLGIDNSQLGHLLDCFTGETLIETEYGQQRIDQIEVGQLVETRFGLRKVTDKWDSVRDVYEFVLSDGTILNCTKDHYFKSKSIGWFKICDMFEQNISLCKKSSQRSTTEGLTLTNQDGISLPEPADTTGTEGSINKNGLTLMVPYLLATTSITSTETDSTTNCQTSNASKELSIVKNTCKKGWLTIQNGFRSLQKKEGWLLLNGMGQKRVSNGIDNTQKNLSSVISTTEQETVKSAKKNTKGADMLQGSVPITANPNSGDFPELIMSTEVVNVERSSPVINTSKQDSVIHAPVNVVSMRYIGQRRVYDITVDEHHEFYANGILAHNCARYFSHATFINWLKVHKS